MDVKSPLAIAEHHRYAKPFEVANSAVIWNDYHVWFSAGLISSIVKAHGASLARA
jgi:hypothetical protein